MRVVDVFDVYTKTLLINSQCKIMAYISSAKLLSYFRKVLMSDIFFIPVASFQ
jgi:hypothetical protein